VKGGAFGESQKGRRKTPLFCKVNSSILVEDSPLENPGGERKTWFHGGHGHKDTIPKKRGGSINFSGSHKKGKGVRKKKRGDKHPVEGETWLFQGFKGERPRWGKSLSERQMNRES